jgi:carbonic anhydrase
MNCKKAFKKLKSGNKRFVNSMQINHDIGVSINSKLVTSQKPFAVILTCSDSRVGVNEIFDTRLGDLFIIKNAGNIISKSTLASMEFAITKLKVKLILVLSHQNCGAVKYAKSHPETNKETDKNLNYLLKQIRFVLKENKELSNKDITIENANHSADGIVENSIIISQKVKEETVKIITGYYKISNGKVAFFKHKSL